MAERLTDTITGLVSPDQLERLGAVLGATPVAASSALGQSADALIAGLAELATPAGGTTRVGELLEREGITGVDRLDEALERGDDPDGRELAEEILGPRTDVVGEAIAASAGLPDPQDGGRALGLVAPVVVSALARQQRDSSLSAASVGALLISRRDDMAATDKPAPADPAEPHPEAEAQLAARALEATRDEAERHEEQGRERRRYVWPFVALFAVGGAILAIVLALTLGNGDESGAPPPSDPTPSAIEPEPPAASPAQPQPAVPEPPAEPDLPTDILVIAEASGEFTTLVGALETAGLDAALRGEGPFTLLAPTDAAFAALPAGALDEIVADPQRLEELLTAHVIEGRHLRESLAERDEITTADGRRLPIALEGANVSIAGAVISDADQEAQNGVLHGVDALVVPEGFEVVPTEPVTVVDVALEDGGFSTLLTALDAANLTDTLRGEGPFTLFAPGDDAFATLPEGALATILAEPAAAEQLLTAHVTGGVHDAAELSGRSDLTMITGQVLQIVNTDAGLTIGGALITASDIDADNGLIHVVDAVILPEGLELGAENNAIDALDDAGEFTSFLAAVEAAGLTAELRSPGPFTILAPTDDAFAALPESVTADAAADPQLLAAIVAAHYGPVALESETIAEAGAFAAASGDQIGVVSEGELIWIGGSLATGSLDSDNAAIHVIDRVILPPALGVSDGTVNELLALAPIPFKIASAEITPAGQRVLGRTVAYLLTSPVQVEIGGHTDADGEEEDNQALSEDRAQAVLDVLVEGGVDAGLLTAVGYGEAQPVASNETPRGRARNRRIEFTILG